MIQYSLLGRTAASIRLNTTFRGLAPSPSSGKTDLTYNPTTQPTKVLTKGADLRLAQVDVP
jgi:hypothetical protein